jgi:hypothetical protein
MLRDLLARLPYRDAAERPRADQAASDAAEGRPVQTLSAPVQPRLTTPVQPGLTALVQPRPKRPLPKSLCTSLKDLGEL